MQCKVLAADCLAGELGMLEPEAELKNIEFLVVLLFLNI